jgi:hypothetical protein
VILVFSVPIDLRDVRFKDVHAINILKLKKWDISFRDKKRGSIVCRKSLTERGCTSTYAGAFWLLRALRRVAFNAGISVVYAKLE